MGKGDKKSRRGKIVLGTFGARRHRKETKKLIPAAPIHIEEKMEAEAQEKSTGPKRKIKTTAAH
jgi:ribosomal small subunit protein bTHX